MKIASFNAQRFGLRKALDQDVLSTMIKVKIRNSYWSWAAAAYTDHKDNMCLTDWYLCCGYEKRN